MNVASPRGCPFCPVIKGQSQVSRECDILSSFGIMKTIRQCHTHIHTCTKSVCVLVDRHIYIYIYYRIEWVSHSARRNTLNKGKCKRLYNRRTTIQPCSVPHMRYFWFGHWQRARIAPASFGDMESTHWGLLSNACTFVVVGWWWWSWWAFDEDEDDNEPSTTSWMCFVCEWWWWRRWRL